MKKIELKRIKACNYKSFSDLLQGRSDLKCEFGKTTKISGRNREGKSTISDIWFDVLTGKMADGSQPDSIRPHNENGVEIDRVDISRELDIAIDGIPVSIKKKTAQKWRKPKGKSEEVFDGNATTYSIDGFEKKPKDFQKWQESIADPDVLLMCSSANPFLNTVQKSTSEARKTLERMSGFDLNEFVKNNTDDYDEILSLTKGNSIEETIKQLRKTLNSQKNKLEVVRTQLSYEKSRVELDSDDIPSLEKRIEELNEKIKSLNEKETKINDLSKEYDEKSLRIMKLKFDQSEIVRESNESIVSFRKKIDDEIFSLNQEKKTLLNDLRMSDLDLKHANMALERYTAEIKRAQEEWKKCSGSEYPEEHLDSIKAEMFNENSIICPTCGQTFPEEQADKIRAEFEEKKAKRIKDEEGVKKAFYEAKDKRLSDISDIGNKAVSDRKAAQQAKKEADEKIILLKKQISDLTEQILKKEKELDDAPQSADLSQNMKYLEISRMIDEEENALVRLSDGSDARSEIKDKRDAALSDMVDCKSKIERWKMNQADNMRRIDELEKSLKIEGQRCADIERNIDRLTNFSIKKNEALAEKINPHFRHFHFEFLDYTKEGNPFETLKLICDGTNYFEGLNGGDQKLVELDLCRGLQEINGLCLPIWLDEANTIDPERIPQDLEQQLICLERADCGLKVEAM